MGNAMKRINKLYMILVCAIIGILVDFASRKGYSLYVLWMIKQRLPVLWEIEQSRQQCPLFCDEGEGAFERRKEQETHGGMAMADVVVESGRSPCPCRHAHQSPIGRTTRVWG
jgi:hypothetical protein